MNKTLQKNITIICSDEASTLETIAFRGVLEYFAYAVTVKWVGNKKDFLDILQGKIELDDLIIISAHGDDGKFFMPTEECVLFDELNINLPNKNILSVGCETSGAKEKFMKGKCKNYIAPKGSPEGNDSLFFIVKFFWLLSQNKTLKESFDGALTDMPIGSEFTLSQNLL